MWQRVWELVLVQVRICAAYQSLPDVTFGEVAPPACFLPIQQKLDVIQAQLRRLEAVIIKVCWNIAFLTLKVLNVP